MPYAFIVGFISLWITNTTFGLSAGIVFIILFGIVSIDSILLNSHRKKILHRTHNLKEAMDTAVRQRLRPV